MFNKRGLDIKTSIKSISDTIVILTPAVPEIAFDIHGRLCQQAIVSSIEYKIPLRGATSYGEFNHEENIMIGPAIDEAAAWHENVEWFGSIMTPSAFFLGSHNTLSCWRDYDIQCHEGIFKTACVNWVPSCNKSRDEICKAFIEMGPIVPKFAKKYINTLDYYDYCCKQDNISPGLLNNIFSPPPAP